MQQHRPSKIIVVEGYSHKILKNSYTKYLQKVSISDWRSWLLQNPKKITRYRRLLNPLVTSGRKKVFKTVEWVIAPGFRPEGEIPEEESSNLLISKAYVPANKMNSM